MGPFARKYGNRAGSEAWTLVYLMKTVVALWRGELPLARTGWFCGLGGLLLLICPLTYFGGIDASPSWSPVVLGLSTAVMAYSSFIAVAIWRSAGRYTGASAWRFLARGSVLFVAVQVVVGMSLG